MQLAVGKKYVLIHKAQTSKEQTMCKLIIYLVAIVSICLVGCESKNPLITSDKLNLLKNYYVAGGDDTTFICIRYYSQQTTKNKISSNLAAICDKRLKKDYAVLKRFQPLLIQEASFANFADPKLWQAYVGQ